MLHLVYVSGQFDSNFTLQNVWGRLQSDSRSIIQCLSDDSHKKIKFSRKLDTGQGAKLPKMSQQFMQGKPVFARILFMPGDDKLNRFGVFQCRIVKGNVPSDIVTLKMPPVNLVELDALHPYQVANVGDAVILEVNITKKLELGVRWRHNGIEVPEWSDQLKVDIKEVKVSDAGIYECYYEGRRAESVHALFRIIVRSCLSDLYGPDCDQECPPCYNGGICHDKWGVCVCPAGFNGTQCENACGGNHFGSDCSKFCSPPQNSSKTDELCASHLFCKPDPYGCSCAPGFKGSSCMEHCEPGWYGADCKQPCHCAYGISSCNRITGACDGGCARGWRGSSCQIEDPNANNSYVETTTLSYCPHGSYGPSCERECHCAGGEHCHVVTGHCPLGCEEGWGGPSCGVCRSGRFGENCELNCHCEGGHHNCDKDGFCHSGCEAGWAGFTCQAECTPGRFGPNCASTCHCHENSTTPCDKMTGVCEGDCEPGYMGNDCQTLCPQNMYGVNCVHSCTCVNGGHCNRLDGSCTCEGRWKGTTCNESEPQVIAATDEEVNMVPQVFISCTADAVPQPLMNISSSEFSDLVVSSRTLEKNQYQAVVKVKPVKAGMFEFMCTAKNQHGFDMKKMTLTVIGPPKLTEPPWLLGKTNHSLSIGWRDWEYAKDTGGSPTDKIEYMIVYRKSWEVQQGRDAWEKTDGGWTTEVSGSVEGLIPHTAYEVAVRCRRLSKGGEGDPSPPLLAQTECGVPTADGIAQEVLPLDISQTTVTLAWKPPFEDPLRCSLTGYYLTYHPEADESIQQFMELGADSTQAEMEDLSPYTTYVIRLYAVTQVQRSKYFVELTLRTGETIPDAVTHLECQAVEGQGDLLLASWEAPSDINGVIRNYIVTYSLLDKGHCGTTFEDMRQIIANDTESTIQNLHPYSTYNVSVQARNAAGDSEPVSVVAETAQGVPDSPPQNIHVVSSDAWSLTFRWDPVPCEYSNGMIHHYEYTVLNEQDIYPVTAIKKREIRDDKPENFPMKEVKDSEVTVMDLQPFTEYGFIVRGVTEVGAGPPSDILYHKTEEYVPSEPRHLKIVSTSSTFIGLSWSEPKKPNGRIKQYRIQFWDHVGSKLAANVLYDLSLKHDDAELTTEVQGLIPATDFFIKIQAATKVGWGEYSSPITGRTLEGAPGEPSEVEVLNSTQTSMELAWKEPLQKNGLIAEYKIVYKPVSTLDPEFNKTKDYSFAESMLKVEGTVYSMVLTGLHPSTEYSISVSARTSAGYGQEAKIKSWTIISGDHVSPSLRTLEKKVTNETILIAFSTTGSKAVLKYQVIVEDSRNTDPVDESLLSGYETAVEKQGLPYYIAAELDPSNVTEEGEHLFVVGDKKTWGGYKNVHLNPGHQYKIRIRTLVYKDAEVKSVLSKPEHETAASTEIIVDKKPKPKILGLDLLAFILILLGAVVLITAIIFFTTVVILVKKRRKKSTNSFSTRDSGLSGSMTWSVMYKVPDREAMDGPLVADTYKTLPLSEKHSSLKRTKSDSKIVHGLRIEALEDFVNNALETNQLTEEFKRLVEGQTSAWTVARKTGNVKKNRYGNIVPYDRSRVVLLTESNKGDSDYINASYVDGYRRPREYIVTQGPLDSTVGDFWRMVWQENSPVIVMITDLVENGKPKCSKYWPEDSMMCGDIQILTIHQEHEPDLVIRTFLLRKLDEVSTHRVVQYQYLAWPDRTIPHNTHHFVRFLRRVREDHTVMGGPLIVHCSAGAGRSGTYVAIDALHQQAMEDRRVEVFRFVNNARHQRVHFVQTQEQYKFIYEALVEAVLFEDTSVRLEKIRTHLKEVEFMSTLDQRALILKQFNKLTRVHRKIDPNRCSIIFPEVNNFRSRDSYTASKNGSPPALLPENGDEDTTVYVEGYRQQSTYLVTQMPMAHTIQEFWRMVYQAKASLIVMLDGSEELEDSNIGIYWPEFGDCNFGEFSIQVVTFETLGDVVTRVMRLSHTGKVDEQPMKVIQLQYKGWSTDVKPASMIRLLDTVERCHKKSNGGPILVHCMDGSTRSGLFVASAIICQQVKNERILDAYQVVRAIRTRKSDFISNVNQYRFLFEIAQEVADSIMVEQGTVEELPPTKKLSFKI